MRPANEVSTARIKSGDVRYLRTASGAPLVLLHTLRTQLEYFDRLIAELDTTRFEVFAADLVGHGQSSAPPADYTASFFTDAVAELLDVWGVEGAVVSGDSIGGAIALGLAARGNRRTARVVAVNPYDYGQGARRSSALGGVIFEMVLWPGVGPLVARAGTPGLLRRILEGGVHDKRVLPAELVDDLYQCGRLPGHADAFRSLNRNWKSWVQTRHEYRSITTPVSLVYGDHDWSRPAERDANANTIPNAGRTNLSGCGHFASLEKPNEIARVISNAA